MKKYCKILSLTYGSSIRICFGFSSWSIQAHFNNSRIKSFYQRIITYTLKQTQSYLFDKNLIKKIFIIWISSISIVAILKSIIKNSNTFSQSFKLQTLKHTTLTKNIAQGFEQFSIICFSFLKIQISPKAVKNLESEK